MAATFLWLLIALLAIPWPAFGASLQSKKDQLSDSRVKASTLQRDLNRLARSYERTRVQLIRTDAAVRVTQKQAAAAELRLRARQAVLAHRVSYIYRQGKSDTASVFLGSEDFGDFATRLEYLLRIAESDRRLLNAISAEKQKLERKKVALLVQKEKQRALAKQLRQQERGLERRLDRQQRAVASLQTEIKRVEAQLRRAAQTRERARKMRLMAQRAKLKKRLYRLQGNRSRASYRSSRDHDRGGGIAFPVDGPHAFTNSWGAPRSGGRRHKGTDIFAPYGAPVVATVSGTVQHSSGGNGGKMVWLRGDDGNVYFYAHLSGFGAGGRVAAGEVIGYNGSSGNARGGSPHVHFEFHPGGGKAVNPYPMLRSNN